MPKLPPIVSDKIVIQSRPLGFAADDYLHLWADVFLPARSMAGDGWQVWLDVLRHSPLEARQGLEYRAVRRIVREGVMPDPPPLVLEPSADPWAVDPFVDADPFAVS